MASKILVALDGMPETQAKALARELEGHVAGFKLGDLIDECGIRICNEFARYGEVMADMKLHETPKTMANRARRYAQCTYLTVHGGNIVPALAAAREAVPNTCRVLGITVLTTIDERECGVIYYDRGATQTDRHRPQALIPRKVLEFAHFCQLAGLRGLVCSGHELEELRPYSYTMKMVVPGIQPLGFKGNDQKRTMTPREAVKLGAYRLVVGRVITDAFDPVKAAVAINEETAEAHEVV